MNITFITPCAGNGTRMLPWALMPKEMLPVKSQDGRIVPILLDLIMKAQDAGIDDGEPPARRQGSAAIVPFRLFRSRL